jgi:hypothetical protein
MTVLILMLLQTFIQIEKTQKTIYRAITLSLYQQKNYFDFLSLQLLLYIQEQKMILNQSYNRKKVKYLTLHLSDVNA